MISAFTLQQANKCIEEAQRITRSEMPKSKFSFVGLDGEFIYFNVAAKITDTNEDEILNIVAKTRFEPIETTDKLIYVGKFKMKIM